MKSLLLCLLLFLSARLHAQDGNDRPSRDSFTLSMPVGNENYYEAPIPSSPFVVGPGILQLFPGETLFVEVEEQNGKISGLKVVRENRNPERTLEISFKQNAEGRVHTNMMLKVKNPFGRDLTYDARIRHMKADKWVRTSIMPVRAGLFGIEMWPDVIVSVALHDWRFL